VIQFPPIPPGEPVRVSASSFVSYDECRFRAGARFEGLYGPDSVPAFRGGLAHQVFARHLRSGPIEADAFDQVCREEIGAKHLNMKIASLNLKPSGIRAVIEEVGAMYERFKAFPIEGFRGAEIAFEVDIGSDVMLIGSIDAVFEAENRVRLVDWKTGSLGDPLVQLRFYALLWLLENGELPGVVEAYSVKTGEQLAELPTRAGVQLIAEQVAGMVTGLRDSWSGGTELERRAGPWCQYCAVLDDCPEGQASLAVFGASSSVSMRSLG